MLFFMFILMLSILVLFYQNAQLKRTIKRITDDTNRNNDRISEFSLEIKKLDGTKVSTSRIDYLADNLSKKAGHDEFLIMKRSIKELEDVVFKDESSESFIARSNRIHQE